LPSLGYYCIRVVSENKVIFPGYFGSEMEFIFHLLLWYSHKSYKDKLPKAVNALSGTSFYSAKEQIVGGDETQSITIKPGTIVFMHLRKFFLIVFAFCVLSGLCSLVAYIAKDEFYKVLYYISIGFLVVNGLVFLFSSVYWLIVDMPYNRPIVLDFINGLLIKKGFFYDTRVNLREIKSLNNTMVAITCVYSIKQKKLCLAHLASLKEMITYYNIYAYYLPETVRKNEDLFVRWQECGVKEKMRSILPHGPIGKLTESTHLLSNENFFDYAGEYISHDTNNNIVTINLPKEYFGILKQRPFWLFVYLFFCIPFGAMLSYPFNMNPFLIVFFTLLSAYGLYLALWSIYYLPWQMPIVIDLKAYTLEKRGVFSNMTVNMKDIQKLDYSDDKIFCVFGEKRETLGLARTMYPLRFVVLYSVFSYLLPDEVSIDTSILPSWNEKDIFKDRLFELGRSN
jgi:hypothetical protein